MRVWQSGIRFENLCHFALFFFFVFSFLVFFFFAELFVVSNGNFKYILSQLSKHVFFKKKKKKTHLTRLGSHKFK